MLQFFEQKLLFFFFFQCLATRVYSTLPAYLSNFLAVHLPHLVLSVLSVHVWSSGQKCSRIASTTAGNAVGGGRRWLVSQGPIRGGGCNRSKPHQSIRSHWICSPPALCSSCQRPQWNKHKGVSEVPINAHAGREMVQFSSEAPRILTVCPYFFLFFFMEGCESVHSRRLCPAAPLLLCHHHSSGKTGPGSYPAHICSDTG